MKVCAVLLSAGSSVRMGVDKLLLDLNGSTPLSLSFNALCASRVDEIIITTSEATKPYADSLLLHSPLPAKTVPGGDTRQGSVFNALMALEDCDIVLIHDAARCLVTPALINACIDAAIQYSSGIAAIPVRDTLRDKNTNQTVDREPLLSMQTPQAFSYHKLKQAYELAEQQGIAATDDLELYLRAGHEPHYVTGELTNQKITHPYDLPFFEQAKRGCRVGFGEDTHRLTAGRKLILGGVEVPFHLGLEGHSDADVLLHAVIDALLGAVSSMDIGRHFPDTEEAYRGADSLVLLEKTREIVDAAGFAIMNIDGVINAQQPKLAPYMEAMQENIEGALRLNKGSVSIKAKTGEGIGPVGKLECMTARCIALVVPKQVV